MTLEINKKLLEYRKAQTMKENINEMDFIKLKALVLWKKDTVKTIKRQTIHQEQIILKT